MRILLSGGGTAGSVSPLIALFSAFKETGNHNDFLFIGTRDGNPEERMVRPLGMQYKSIHSGKLRRYLDIRNFIDPFLVLIGFVQSFFIISKFNPDVIIGAGSFVSVPVIWAGWVMNKKILIHQQDIRPSFSNVLAMKLANVITTTFEESRKFFPKNKTHLIGNPSRLEQTHKFAELNLEINKTLPIVMFVGGGTGAEYINNFVSRHLGELTKNYLIVHVTGFSKYIKTDDQKNYLKFDFLDDKILAFFNKATVVISRAGMSTLTELCLLSKPSIIIPLPHTHQVDNANYFFWKGAIELHDQENDTDVHLIDLINQIVTNESLRLKLSHQMGKMMKKNASSAMISLIKSLV